MLAKTETGPQTEHCVCYCALSSTKRLCTDGFATYLEKVTESLRQPVKVAGKLSRDESDVPAVGGLFERDVVWNLVGIREQRRGNKWVVHRVEQQERNANFRDETARRCAVVVIPRARVSVHRRGVVPVSYTHLPVAP